MIPVKVQVQTENGSTYEYVGLFPTTWDALLDALDKFGIVKVSVEPLGRAINCTSEGSHATK